MVLAIDKLLSKSSVYNRKLKPATAVHVSLLFLTVALIHAALPVAAGQTENVRVILNSYNEVFLFWSAPQADVIDYEVRYKSESTDYAFLANTDNATMYVQKDLAAEKQYFYEVYAITKDNQKILIDRTSITTAKENCTPSQDWCFKATSLSAAYPASYVGHELPINVKVLQEGSKNEGAVFLLVSVTKPSGQESEIDAKKVYTSKGQEKQTSFVYIPEENGEHKVQVELISPTGYSFDKKTATFYVSEELSAASEEIEYFQYGGWKELMVAGVFATFGAVVFLLAVRKKSKKT
ncbi:MAG: hypothetical protein DA330_10235 [Nitrososphaera sp.]|nr:hypothetical protein [Nitrososphaera sp.]